MVEHLFSTYKEGPVIKAQYSSKNTSKKGRKEGRKYQENSKKGQKRAKLTKCQSHMIKLV